MKLVCVGGGKQSSPPLSARAPPSLGGGGAPALVLRSHSQRSAPRAASRAALSFLCLRGKYSSHAPHVEQVRSAGSRPQLPSPAARPRAQEAGGRLISAAAARRRRVYVL